MSSFFVSNNFGGFSTTAATSAPSGTWERTGLDPAPEDDIPRAPVNEEQIKSTMPIPAFLPWYDTLQNIEETAEMRLAYRAMLKDPNIKSAFLGKMFAVMSQDFVIHPANKKDERAVNIAKF